mmetsp:Transcript_13465/g.31653  ORF Transcript_13465/g.31653 Transcript_13465/m.31653 type:complete len:142 (+) Transcript_13465:199-624(+)
MGAEESSMCLTDGCCREGEVRAEYQEMSKRMNEQTQYGVGVLWLVKQNKLIVTGFARGSAAREAGVRAGDILKAVDDIDVFHMAHATLGVNPVGQLLSGPVNSECKLTLLRFTQGPDGQDQAQEVTFAVRRVVSMRARASS